MTDTSDHIDMDPIDRLTCEHCQAELGVSGVASFSEITCPECQATLTVPARLGGFRLLSLLGQGGMGAVYRGEDISLDRQVAIKVLLRSVGNDPSFVETFQREAKAAAALNHPNIVQIYQFGREKGQSYIAMELLTGGHLDKMISDGKPLDAALVAKIGLDVAEGLKAAAEIGLTHGDIKPENILLDANGNAKVVDFGLAAFMDREGRDEGVWGTPYYIAPEKVRGRPGDLRSDIYSLGATLFHALTLKPPFEGRTAAEVVKARLSQAPPPIDSLRPDIHPEIARVVMRMLESDPARRYPTYVSLIADLRGVAAKIGPPHAGARFKRTSGKITLAKQSSGLRSSAGLSAAAGCGDAEAKASPRRPGSLARVLLVLFLLIAMAGGGWHGWRYYSARQAEAERRALMARYRHDARTALAEMGQTIERTSQALSETALLLPSATNRLAAADRDLRAAGLEGGLTNAAPELAAVPERIGSAVESARIDIDAMRDLHAGASEYLNRLRAASDSRSAHRLMESLTRAAAGVGQQWQAVRETLDDAAGYYGQLDRLDELVSQAAERAAAAERQRLEEERLRREQEARQREEEERQRRHAEQVKAERERLAAGREELLTLIRSNDFEAALARAQLLQPEFQTEEVQREAGLWVARLELLPVILPVIIERLGAGPWRWGWDGRLDILGADARGVLLPGERRVPWSDVPVDQMLRFIHNYADAREIDRSQRARFNMAAAAYCYENKALPLARNYADKAIGYRGHLRDEIRRIMPEIKGL